MSIFFGRKEKGSIDERKYGQMRRRRAAVIMKKDGEGKEEMGKETRRWKGEREEKEYVVNREGSDIHTIERRRKWRGGS